MATKKKVAALPARMFVVVDLYDDAFVTSAWSDVEDALNNNLETNGENTCKVYELGKEIKLKRASTWVEETS